ncbi:MAG: 2-hydroxychromene-2-carboxylate isomerase [Myxococcales bacterium]|nr:2-hydroxychromene-2-carboxylate isomerase [Myxococcales bacterium]
MYSWTVLELWFDFSCPYAYLASRRAPAVARDAGVTLMWRPMLLGGVFRGIGAGDGPNATLGPAKARHNYQDMHRWAELFGARFRLPAAHPMRTVRALRVLLALPDSRWDVAIEAIFAAYWQRAEDITRDDVIAAALAAAGVSDADIAAALARADDMKDELRRRTEEAIALGIFGAPAWVIRRAGDHVLIWGQDRIEWVSAVLAGWDPEVGPPPGGPRRITASTPEMERSQRTLASATEMERSQRTLASAIDCYFDVASPFAYLGLTQLPALADTTLRLRPILLGGLFRDIGQADVPLFAMNPPKQRYVAREMVRWARWWGVPFDSPRKFPQRTVQAQRLCILAAERGATEGVRLATALGRAMWAEQRDLEDRETLRAVLAECGLPPDWVNHTSDPELKAKLVANTEAAKAAGVFGVPTFIVDDKYLFWGQDRLDLVTRALAGWKPVHG